MLPDCTARLPPHPLALPLPPFGRRNMFESMLFLFVIHPYDVGDLLLVDLEQVRVKKISLLYTELVRWNGERVFAPNTTLSATKVTNLTRSKTKAESMRQVPVPLCG